MKLVFLTTKCKRAAVILNHLSKRGIAIDAIIIEHPARYKTGKFLIKRVGFIATVKIAFKRALGLLLPRLVDDWIKEAFYLNYTDKVYTVSDFNGKQCESLLRELKPEIVALGYSKILRGNIIEIPEIGILNVHPGLLPKYRGINTIHWAIYNGDNIGVTVHFIDIGVDTGPIIEQRVIDVEENDTIESLSEKADAIAGELLSDTIYKIFRGVPLAVNPQLFNDGKQYYKMSPKLLRETKHRLKRRLRKSPESYH